MKPSFLRKKYPKFIYKSFSFDLKKDDLVITFDFRIPPDFKFLPKVTIKNIGERRFKKIKKEQLENLVFHLGLIETLSYWKATCSPKIRVEAGYLTKEQISWWQDLILRGMGQFFYENKIDWRPQNFLTINCTNKNKYQLFDKKLKERFLVPFGGGRDSIITLESLKKPFNATQERKRREIALFLVNPNQQIRKVVSVAGIKKQIIIKRTIDKKLLKLNEKGYLNGHTPFTAVLSFLSVLCAVLFNYKNIVFSCEKSADEGNVKYLGEVINHQWAKSSEFEKMFKKYSKKYLAKDINYFSYLRKYGELEISKMLTKYPKYLPVFSSCNASMKINARPIKWCGNCPKCLFVYATLYPFLEKEQLLKIFGKDIFENKKLLPAMEGLINPKMAKPFECVGTKKESQQAFKLSLKKAQKEGKVPYLLTKFS